MQINALLHFGSPPMDPNFQGGRYQGFSRAGFPDGQGRWPGREGGAQGGGSWYRGEWSQGRRHGRGVGLSPNGEWYKGDRMNDLPYGECISQMRKTAYIGGFRFGMRDGVGWLITPDGEVTRTEGSWEAGVKQPD
jgi:hypothetical protein